MRVTLSTLTAAGLLALAAGGQSPDSPKAEPAKTVVVPFEMLKSGHMAVMVKVNDKGPYRLIFDTGAPMSLVNNKLARDSGMIKGGKGGGGGGLFGGMLSAQQTSMKTLDIGGAKAEDVPTVVMDHPTVEAISTALGKEINGLVGFPFFGRFKMTLDYKAKTMTLTPNGYKPDDVMQAMNAMMMAALTGKQTAKVLSASSQWGLLAGKASSDQADGVEIKGVVPGGAADKAGLRKGDRLLTLDGRWTDSLPDLYEAASFVKAGSTVTVRVKREDKEMDLRVTPAKGM